MRFTERWTWSLVLLLALTLATPITSIASAQRPARGGTLAPAAPLTPAAATAAVRTAFRNVLTQSAVSAAVRTEVLRQVSANRTVGLMDGVWATPIDVGRIYNLPAVRAALLTNLGSQGAAQIDASIGDPDQMVVTFTPGQLASIMGTMVQDVTASIGVEAIKRKLTDVVGADDVMIVLIVYAGLFTAGAAIREWWDGGYSKSGSGSGSTAPTYNPNADIDGDGIINMYDDDDDGDGVPDEQDQYPDDPSKSICDCGRPGGTFVGATFPQGLAAALFSALDASKTLARSAISVGAVSAGQSAQIRVVVP